MCSVFAILFRFDFLALNSIDYEGRSNRADLFITNTNSRNRSGGNLEIEDCGTDHKQTLSPKTLLSKYMREPLMAFREISERVAGFFFRVENRGEKSYFGRLQPIDARNRNRLEITMMCPMNVQGEISRCFV